MSLHDYHFVTRWRVVGTVQEVADVLGNGADLPRWWPSVYLEAEELLPGGEGGVGKVVRVLTKGWLPYTLSWQFRVTESRDPFGFALETAGDLVGSGVWDFEQDGAWVHITYDWRIEANRPLLRLLAPLLRPAFAANHRWAMRQGERSLAIELERRRAAPGERNLRLAAPPTGNSPVALFLAAAGLAFAATLAVRRLSKRRRHRRRFRIGR
jgi:hypothetical protein